jgi:hypothetical protein
MKLIIVDRAKPETYARLKTLFEDDLNVEVLWERRSKERRRGSPTRGPERRSQNRRKLDKAFNGRDYIVIYIA